MCLYHIFYRFKSEIKKMSPLPTRLITDGIYSVKTEFVNFYIIQDDNNYIAIDAGNDIEGRRAGIKKN